METSKGKGMGGNISDQINTTEGGSDVDINGNPSEYRNPEEMRLLARE